MSKSVTSWNSSSKGTSPWATVTKSGSAWVNSATKSVTTYSQAVKNSDQWGIKFQAPQTYFYNDATITYNSVFDEYNYLVNNNTITPANQTSWSVTE